MSNALDHRQPLMNAHWCRALATLLASGLSAQEVMTKIKAQDEYNPAFAEACSKVIVEIEQGVSFVMALTRHNFFNRYQLEQLKIGERAGTLPSVLLKIATRLERQQERNQRLKIQLKLSQAIIAISLIAGVLLAVAKGTNPLSSLVVLMVVVIVTKIIYQLLDADIFQVLAQAWTSKSIHKIAILKRLFEYYWYDLLVGQLEAGIDTVQAIDHLHDLIPSPLLRHNIRVCQRHLEQGHTLVLALSQAQLVLTSEMKQVLLVGEKSGRLVAALKHHLATEEQKLELTAATFYEWLPRLYYLLTVSVVLHFVM